MTRKPNPKNKRRAIYIDDELWERIRKQAAKDGRSASNWMRRAFEKSLAPSGKGGNHGK